MGTTIVGLNTDEFYEKYRGYKPIMSYQERYEMIASVFPEVSIFPNDQESGNAKDLITSVGADLIVVGSDWARKDYVGQLGLDWDWLDEWQIGICYVNYTDGVSSTKLKERIKNA